MKKLVITIAAFGLLTGCTHFSPEKLHNAYQKTKDSYAFVKDAYKGIRDDAKVVLNDVQDAAENLQQDLHYAGKDWDNAVTSMSYSFDQFKKAATFKEYSEME